MANKSHKEVELQSRMKLVVSKFTGKFSGTSDIVNVISIINRVIEKDPNIGFLRSVTGEGVVLGNVLVIDLNVPIGRTRTRTKATELNLNMAIARAINNAYGRCTVGYVSPTASRTIKLTVEADSETDVRNALNGVASITSLEVE